MRVEVFGCNDSDLDRLRGISLAIRTSVRSQLEPAAKRLIDYGASIIAGTHGLPFGVGAALATQLERIGSLLQISGGFSELEASLKEKLELATEIANEVVIMEAKALAMPYFHAHGDARETRKGTGSVGGSKDRSFVVMAQEASRKIGDLLENAVNVNQISFVDLFDENYLAIEGTNPQQYSALFLSFADTNFPDLQETILESNGAIVFAVAVDRNGYLPTHNRKFSFPQGGDPVWNAAHCRGRRIFNDKTGLGAARNTTPLLLQTYLRDMGGGEVAIMRDASAPIWVNGQHWGAFRVGYPIF